MRKYSNFDTLTYAAVNTTIVAVSCGTNAKAHVYSAIFSASDTPADVTISVDLSYSTSVNGTSTNQTSSRLDLNDPAADADGRINYTAEPTYNALPIVKFSFHQANTYTWEEREQDGIICAATSGQGVGARIVAVTASTPAVGCELLHAE
jgi:hypothetical protein